MKNYFIKIFERFIHFFLSDDYFLNQTKGVIHIGANIGQEAFVYSQKKLNVIWIEPILDIYLTLQNNINLYKNQKAFQYLITDCDDKLYDFYISNNYGMSSSILEINLHKKLWPNVYFENKIQLKSITLIKFIQKENIDISKFNSLILDTQGSELLVLKGAEKILNKFKYIKIEVPDFDSYVNCCKLNDIESYLNKFNFFELKRKKFASHAEVGTYYDIVYKNISTNI